MLTDVDLLILSPRHSLKLDYNHFHSQFWFFFFSGTLVKLFYDLIIIFTWYESTFYKDYLYCFRFNFLPHFIVSSDSQVLSVFRDVLLLLCALMWRCASHSNREQLLSRPIASRHFNDPKHITDSSFFSREGWNLHSCDYRIKYLKKKFFHLFIKKKIVEFKYYGVTQIFTNGKFCSVIVI